MKVLLSLVQNLDIFAWSPYEVPDVDLEFIVHKLKQKLRQSAKSHMEAVKEEVEKLKQAGAIKEVFFPD